VNHHADQLREAFESHEHLAPDLGAVYNGTQALFRKYKRRRRSVQVAGGAVLGAGLFAAGTHLPASLLPGATVPQPVVAVPSPSASPSSRPVPSTAPSIRPLSVPTTVRGTQLTLELDAYDHAGYGYGDAVQLAAMWKTQADILYVKAEAGRLLLVGKRLPIPPHPDPAGSDTPDVRAMAAIDAFADAGYDYDDATRLAQLWNLADPSDAKVKGGEKLLAGDHLPIRP
jgi:hypothetical protein